MINYIIRPDGSRLNEGPGIIEKNKNREFYFYSEMYNIDGWYFCSSSNQYVYLISGSRVATFDPENLKRNKCEFTNDTTYKTKEEIEKVIKMKSFY